MTDQEKKEPDDSNWPTMVAISLLAWTLVFSCCTGNPGEN